MMAILDRLLHHGEVFYLRGASYRLGGKEPLVLGAAATSQPSGSDGPLLGNNSAPEGR
ncbi:MAG: hypothetical protein H7Y32_07325 [Chloroflexales bacterium]|nr:hypothetical protein [Chloroflexales bacterium]